ncbi:uncharacterized protein LOC142151641 [Mixophyes fleayi]|uniref:uncharacterized protein LOC142151641 n=1 Tax=Mixophyes fleayi TaxID=3061075 RepID=UPI003F4DAF7D
MGNKGSIKGQQRPEIYDGLSPIQYVSKRGGKDLTKGMRKLFKVVGLSEEGTLKVAFWKQFVKDNEKVLKEKGYFKRCQMWCKLAEQLEDDDIPSNMLQLTNLSDTEEKTPVVGVPGVPNNNNNPFLPPYPPSPSGPIMYPDLRPLSNNQSGLNLRQRPTKQPDFYGQWAFPLVTGPPPYNPNTKPFNNKVKSDLPYGTTCKKCFRCVPPYSEVCPFCGRPQESTDEKCDPPQLTTDMFPLGTSTTLDNADPPVVIRRTVQHRPWTPSESRDICDKSPDPRKHPTQCLAYFRRMNRIYTCTWSDLEELANIIIGPSGTAVLKNSDNVECPVDNI